jgi:3-oxoacyl-[acyl-carrier protein] reductase
MNPMSLSGRNILVTGAAQGIGLAASRLLSSLGAQVTLVDRNAAALNEVVAGLPAERALAVAGSVTDRHFVEAVVAQSAARFGGVHGLVNNAGVTRPARIDKMTIEEWQAVIDVNLTGAFNCLQAVGREMVGRAKAGEGDAGSIVNISSDAGRKGTVGQINYGAAKSGVLGLTMSAAREWGRYGVRVNSVAYGIVETDMTETVRGEKFRDRYRANIPLGRFLSAEEAAYSIAFLLSPAAVFITGQHLSVNGGSHITA